jgi:hypothetical protein
MRLHANAAIALVFHSGILGAASVSRIVRRLTTASNRA